MSKMKEAIQKLVDEQITVMAYIPGKGYELTTVRSIDDDVVTLEPEDGSPVVIHYTKFSIERD